MHVVPSLGRGGVERRIVGLVRHLGNSDFRFTVCPAGPPLDFAPELAALGADMRPLGTPLRRPWWRNAQAIKDIALDAQPDVVHSWLYDADMATRVAFLAGLRVPLLVSLAAPIYHADTIRHSPMSPWRVRLLEALDYASAALVHPTFVAPSDYVASTRRVRAGTRLVTIPNAIDPDALEEGVPSREECRSNAGFHDDDIVILNVGRLSYEKDQATLLHAFAVAARRDPRLQLRIVGTGCLEGALNRLINDFDLRERASIVAPTAAIGRYYQAADVFVFPSLHEGFGLVLVEAMWFGLPCVASRIPTSVDILSDGQCGLLFPRKDIAALADAILSVAGDEERRTALAVAARKRAMDYRLTDVVPRWRDLYHAVAKSRATRSRPPTAGPGLGAP
jgi:glycosyltransferase involved in cell wall biosynthesis